MLDILGTFDESGFLFLFAADFGFVVNLTHDCSSCGELLGTVVYHFDLDFLTFFVGAGFGLFISVGISIDCFGDNLFGNLAYFFGARVSGFDFAVPQQVGNLSAKQCRTLIGGSAEFSLNCHIVLLFFAVFEIEAVAV